MSLTDHMHPDELVSSAGALWRDGHVLMRGVLDGDSVSSLRPEFVQTVEQHRAEWPTKVLRAKKETVGGTQAQFDRIFGVRRKTGAGEQLASSTRLASIAAALLGVPCVRFYQDQLFFKGPGMQPSIYHQDSLAAPLDTNRLITLWLPLHNMTRAHGPLRFATGSHTDLNLLFWNEGVRKSEHPFFAYSMIEERFPIAQLGAVGPGDVSAHLGWSVDLRLELDQFSAAERHLACCSRVQALPAFAQDGARRAAKPRGDDAECASWGSNRPDNHQIRTALLLTRLGSASVQWRTRFPTFRTARAACLIRS